MSIVFGQTDHPAEFLTGQVRLDVLKCVQAAIATAVSGRPANVGQEHDVGQPAQWRVGWKGFFGVYVQGYMNLAFGCDAGEGVFIDDRPPARVNEHAAFGDHPQEALVDQAHVGGLEWGEFNDDVVLTA